MGFPSGSDDKESACSTEDMSSIPGLGRSPGEGNGCPLQYSGLENSMERGAWQATIYTKFETSLGDYSPHEMYRELDWTGKWGDTLQIVLSKKFS